MITNALTGDFEWPVGDAYVTWYEPHEVPKPGKLIDCSLAVIDRAQIGDRFWSAQEVLAIVAAAHDRGRRDMLNDILELNPGAALARHIINGGTEDTFDNHQGKLPFDVVFWVCHVADKLGIKSKEDLSETQP